MAHRVYVDVAKLWIHKKFSILYTTFRPNHKFFVVKTMYVGYTNKPTNASEQAKDAMKILEGLDRRERTL